MAKVVGQRPPQRTTSCSRSRRVPRVDHGNSVAGSATSRRLRCMESCTGRKAAERAVLGPRNAAYVGIARRAFGTQALCAAGAQTLEVEPVRSGVGHE